MADWNLDSFLSKLTLVQNPIQFVTGANDKTVPSSVSQEWAKRIASAEFIAFGGYGHLIHEETPETIAPLITRGL
jgi:magnesium chelatase accessory protein